MTLLQKIIPLKINTTAIKHIDTFFIVIKIIFYEFLYALNLNLLK